ncbi:S-adenosyl-L-methionine-dependent methyltransferase [Aspergillus falconensis]
MNTFDLFDVIDDDASDASSVTIDNDPDRLYFLRETFQTSSAIASSPSGDFSDLTDNEVIHDGEYGTDECVEILREDWLASARTARSPLPAFPGKRQLHEFCGDDGIVYKPGQSVELYVVDDDNENTFLRICSIWKDLNGEISFGGRQLRKFWRRNTHLHLPKGSKWRNELVWVANETAEIPLGLVRRFVIVHFTNLCHIDQDPQKTNYPNSLFCRLKAVTLKDTHTSVEYLTFEEADVNFRVPSTSLRHCWRGETALFGSEKKPEEGSQPPVVVLDDIYYDSQDPILKQKAQRTYTFGDGFCGAGGISCGAKAAGLRIKWAFDSSSHAAATYQLNFDGVVIEQSDIFNFLTNDENFLRVDVSHGSPPCQTFSPAHTIAGPNDDANSACIFSCGNLIRRAKPRVHTMEETSGLLDRHKETFLEVIRDFVEIGYSVRWDLLNCMEYGVPQRRRRLIIIASGPGERLPRLPRPTHGPPGSGLLHLTTINQVISTIPTGTPDHDVAGARSRGSRNRRAPFDANQQARTITCGGGDNNYHPSGRRGFTNREFACLQTFPLNFRFGRREVRKQIGNAVPPLLAKAVYREIIRSLQETDERELRQNQ